MQIQIPKSILYPLSLDFGVAFMTYAAISITNTPMPQAAGSPISPDTLKAIMFVGSIIGIYGLAFVLGKKAVVGGAYYAFAVTAALIPVTVLQSVSGFARHSTSSGVGFGFGAILALVTLAIMNFELGTGPGTDEAWNNR